MGACQSIEQACSTDPVVRRTVTRKMGEMEGIYDKLVKSHSFYCKVAGMGLRSSDSSEYMNEMNKLKFSATQLAQTVLGDDEEASKAANLKRNRKLVETLKTEVECAIPSLMELTSTDLTSEGYEEAMETVREAANKMERYLEVGALVEDLEEENIAKEYSDRLAVTFKDHKTKLMDIKIKLIKKSPSKPVQTVTAVEDSGVTIASAKKQPVKIKPLDCPTWDGKFKTFARFKLLWDENITPRHEESALHYMLCQSLPKHILDNISTLTNTAAEIWAYLEDRYGKPKVVAKEIMKELMELDHRKFGTQKFMIKFCTTLHDTHSLLINLGEEDWLTSSRTVSELESKLPREEKIEWAKSGSGHVGETDFERFKNFLTLRKSVMEALESMGGLSGDKEGNKCSFCGKNGHTEDVCFSKKRAEKGSKGSGKRNSGCAICGSEDHWKNECPDRGSNRDRKAKTNKGAATGAGKNNVDVGSNSLRPLECQRCKFSSKLTKCAGCKKTSNINHCLLHCPEFNLLSVVDKTNVVKSSKSCAICLHPSHTSDKCDFKDKDKNICGMDGCQSHHHPCLHGSKDAYVTGVNVLLMQQIKEVAHDTPQGCVEVSDWLNREKFIQDSYAVGAADKIVDKKRKLEMEEIKQEMAKPLVCGDQVLMTLMNLPIVYGKERHKENIVGFFDDGSNCSVIRKSLAEELGLWGEKCSLELGTVNATTTIETKLYCVELVDISGKRHLIKAFGLDSISGVLQSVNLDNIKADFSPAIKQSWDKLKRPSGREIDLLIGSEVANLHPVPLETVGRMVVKSSIFGTGLVLNGAHEGIKCNPVELECNIQIIRSGCFRSNKIVVKYSQEVDFSSVEEFAYTKSAKEFMNGEDLGCEPPRRCIKCKGCKDCKYRGSNMSPKEAAELAMMEDKMKFDHTIGKWRVKYPFLKDPRVLKNNYRRVLSMQERTEQRIIRAGIVEGTNKVFDKMVENGALKEIGHAELHTWAGPVHYLPIQVVENLSSATTPFRLVTNSSLIDPETGLSLNSILAKGPMALNDMWDIAVGFRHEEYGLSADISKAYYQIKTGVCEKHCRRVLWRHSQVGEPWKIFGFEVVSMGDTCAACLMELTKKGTCKMSRDVDPVAAKKIEDNSFVDDVSTGGNKQEVDRFKGKMNPETLECDGTMPQILSSGGFSIKAIAVTGEPDGPSLEKLGGAVLGLGWSTATDLMKVTFKVNISPLKHGKLTGPDLTPETLGQLDKAVITKRICLRIASSQYDPLGIISPLTIKMRVGMKELYTMDIGWDTPLGGETRQFWVGMFKSLVFTDGISFRRCTRPVGAVGKCILIGYFDGSDWAFAIAIYARWNMQDGSVFVNLVASKAKVGPMYGTNTVRLELNGSTLLVRVMLRVVVAMADDPPEQVFFAGDSETVLASRERESGFFGEYFGNRIGEQFENQEEIEKITQVGIAGEWYHVPSADNAADRPSRMNSEPRDLGVDSEWLGGPAYLKLPVEQWPFNRNFADKKSKLNVPMEEVKKKFRNQVDGTDYSSFKAIGGPGCQENYVLNLFDHGWKTNDWEKLIRSTSYLFLWKAKMLSDEPGAIAREFAILFWIRVAMPFTNKAASEGKLKHLSPYQHPVHSDILVVTGRASSGLQRYFQKDYLPILMSKTRTAYLIMLWAHNQDHGGVDNTFQTSLQVAWIIGGRALARGIKKSCVRCRFLAKKLAGQQMAVLPEMLGVPSPCFTYVAVDLAGPFTCKKEGGSQTTRRNQGTLKVWAVLIVCLQTKAVKIYLVTGLSTEDFLLAWDSFVGDYGQPLKAFSDRGTNLVSASKEEEELPNYNWDNIEAYTHGSTSWHFHPAQSQFRNGAVESFVKKFKRTLVHKFGDRQMYMMELQCAFKVVASILNSRPIYARWGGRGLDDPDFLMPLTPNMILTGRANTVIPVRDYDTSDKPLLRLKYVEECVSSWWQQFAIQNFSSLVPRQKWFEVERNFQVGDIVLIQYDGKSKPGSYRLGIVRETEEDSDGCVRNATVEYSLLSELPEQERLRYAGITKKKLRVCVQRLVLILPVEEQEDQSVSSDKKINNFSKKGGPDAQSDREAIRASVKRTSKSTRRIFANNLGSCKTVDKKIVEDVTDYERDILFYFCEKFDW